MITIIRLACLPHVSIMAGRNEPQQRPFNMSSACTAD
jgi:hypothetical protein